MPIQLNCPIQKAERLNAHAFAFTLEAGDLVQNAVPGQFVHIKCGEGLLLRRPISICDYTKDTLKVAFEVRGEGTEWLSHRKKGEVLDVLGPLGHGFDLSSKKLLLVGGGIGVPPMLACARHAEGEAHAILGFRSADRAMLISEFESVCKTVTLASDDGTLGYHGYVDTLVHEKLTKENDFTAVLACGPKPMLRAVAKAAEEHGVICQVSMEERMGCGVGACLVCACKSTEGTMKHVCKDGPVFEAGEVDWND